MSRPSLVSRSGAVTAAGRADSWTGSWTGNSRGPRRTPSAPISIPGQRSFIARLEEFMDDTPSFEDAKLGARGRVDAGQVQHGGADHGGRDRLGGRVFAMAVALAHDPARLHSAPCPQRKVTGMPVV